MPSPRQQLADEERVAARDLEARGTNRSSGSLGQAGGDEGADGRRRQGRRAYQLHGGIADERRRLGRQRRIERAGGEDEGEGLPFEPAGDEREDARRRRIAPLQVVDDERERRVSGEVRGEPVEAVVPRVAGIAGGRTRARRHAGRRRRSGDHVRGQRRRSRQPAFALVGVGLEQRALEELADDPEREPLLELGRPRAQHADAEVRGPDASHFEEPRLPDPGRALDQQHSPGAPRHGPQRGADVLDLVLAFEQRCRLGRGGRVHAPVDRKRRPAPCAIFGGRCQGATRWRRVRAAGLGSHLPRRDPSAVRSALASAAPRSIRRSLGACAGHGGLVGRVNGGDEGGEFRPARRSPWGCSTFGRIYSPKGEHLGRARGHVTVRCVIRGDRRPFLRDSSRRGGGCSTFGGTIPPKVEHPGRVCPGPVVAAAGPSALASAAKVALAGEQRR